MLSKQPQPRERHAAVGIGRNLYVWGGFGGKSASIQTATIETFDVHSETWQEAKELRCSLPANLRGMAVTTDGVTAYTFGGRTDHDAYLNTIYEINPRTLQCRELVAKNPSHTPKQAYGSGLLYFNRKLVVHGGRIGQDRTNELHVFDLKAGELGGRAG